MTSQEEQQQRNQASMSLLEKMGRLADEIIEERDNQQRLEKSWQERRYLEPVENEGEQP
jgi:hypothetical protein